MSQHFLCDYLEGVEVRVCFRNARENYNYCLILLSVFVILLEHPRNNESLYVLIQTLYSKHQLFDSFIKFKVLKIIKNQREK